MPPKKVDKKPKEQQKPKEQPKNEKAESPKKDSKPNEKAAKEAKGEKKPVDKKEEEPKKDAKIEGITLRKEGKGKKIAPSKSISKLDKSAEQEKLKVQQPPPEPPGPPRVMMNSMGDNKVNRVKGDDYLIKETGLLQAYEQFLRTICKYGLPTGDIYEFAAQQIEKFQRKKKAKELKMKAEMEIKRAAAKRPQKQQHHEEEYGMGG